MAVAALVQLEEYLSTSYEVDCDYVDGRLVERHVGELRHSYLQYRIARLLSDRGLNAFPELRVQVSERKYRVPDVLAVIDMPNSRYLRRPPYIVVEVLSREDRASEFSERIDDYVAFGVENVWIVDPRRRHVEVYAKSGWHPCTTSVETTDGRISILLDEIFRQMPAEEED